MTTTEITKAIKAARKLIRQDKWIIAMVELNDLHREAAAEISKAAAQSIKNAAGWLTVPNKKLADEFLRDALQALKSKGV